MAPLLSFFLLSPYFISQTCVCVCVCMCRLLWNAANRGAPGRHYSLSLKKRECAPKLCLLLLLPVCRLKKSNKNRRPFSKRLIRSSARQFSPLFGRRRRSFLFYLSRGVPTVKKASAPSPLNSTSPSCRKLKEGEK